MYLKLPKFLLINLFYIANLFAIDVETEGDLVSGFPEISENPTVRMYLNPKYPPVVNITPSRPTILQFPNEIAICQSASKLIKLVYSDKKNGGEESKESNNSESIEAYSSVTVTVSPEEIAKLTVSQLLKLSGLVISCKIRTTTANNTSGASYAWKIVAVKIVEPKFTHLVVHLLERPLIKSKSLQAQILTDKQVEELAHIDLNKVAKTKEGSQKDKKNISPVIEKKEENKKEFDILDLYEFKDAKKL